MREGKYTVGIAFGIKGYHLIKLVRSSFYFSVLCGGRIFAIFPVYSISKFEVVFKFYILL
jgi:hypothetical protein